MSSSTRQTEDYFFNETFYYKTLNPKETQWKHLLYTDLPTPITCKSGGFEKQAQKNLEIRTSYLETSKICVK